MVKTVHLWYPRQELERTDHKPGVIEIDLIDVRASQPIRVEYDFERDGYRILRRDEEWEGDGPEPEWKEKAFVSSWEGFAS